MVKVRFVKYIGRNDIEDVSKFIEYDGNGLKVWSNIVYETGINFSANGDIKGLLKTFLGIDDAAYAQYIQEGVLNSKGVLTDYHGSIPATPRLLASYPTFVDDYGTVYNLFEIGINLGIVPPPPGGGPGAPYIPPHLKNPSYHDNAKHIEIKFALPANTNIRVNTGIHFKHNGNTNIVNAVQQLTQKIDFLVNDLNIRNKITKFVPVSLQNFYYEGFDVAKNSMLFYRHVLQAVELYTTAQNQQITNLQQQAVAKDQQITALRQRLTNQNKKIFAHQHPVPMPPQQAQAAPQEQLPTPAPRPRSSSLPAKLPPAN